MAQPRSLAYRGSTRPYPEGNESDGSRSPQEEKKARKRNSVACARCRKRKIKCTGVNHDGNGCEACQAAGVSKASCHYLRVNSRNIEDVQLQLAGDSDWPYTPPAPANYMTIGTTDPSHYAFTNSPQHGTTPYAGPGGLYSAAQTRPPNNNYQTSFNGSYDVQRPLQGPTPSYSALEYPQQWHSLSSHGRPNSHGLLYDRDPSRYETSTVSYMTSTGTSVPNVAAEGSSIFPGLSPLVSHLPAHGGNRKLPYPMSQPSFDSSNGSIQAGDGTAGLYQQHLETATSQRSVSSASQDATSATGQGSSTSSSSPSETQENSTFSYTPITHRSPSGSGENSLGFHSVGVSTTSHMHGYTADSMSSIRSNQHANSELPRLNSTIDGYGGHRGSQPPDRTLESGMAIKNGNIYDPHGRILQPKPRPSASYDLLRGAFEGSDQDPAKVRKSGGHSRRSDGKR